MKTSKIIASDDEITADSISTSKKDAAGGLQHVSASELRVLVTHWAGNAWTKLCEGGGEGREGKLPFNMEDSEEDVLLAQLKRKVARV
jgi:hypothetical protein